MSADLTKGDDVQGIVLCPRCRVRAEKDDLGELLCPKCGVRLCPNAHIFDGRICPYCGWEDRNYYLWQKAQRTRQQASEGEGPDQLLDGKTQQMCPQCGIPLDPAIGRCSGCGWLHGSKPRTPQQPPVAAAPTSVSETPPSTTMPHKVARPMTSKPGIPMPQSPIMHEIKRLGRREWDFTSMRRFLQPLGASLLVLGVLFILIGVPILVFRQRADNINLLKLPVPVSGPTREYPLHPSIIPAGGGTIHKSPAMETYPAGTEITLTAIPSDKDCFEFDRWEGDSSGSSETMIITMDSNKTVTAYFRPKDTIPPVISEPEVSGRSDTSATITWETDEPTRYQMYYGQTQEFDLPGPLSEEFADGHSIRLAGLESNTTYYIRIECVDKCGNEATSDTKSLETLSPIPVGREVGNRPPDFTLTTLDGKELTLSKFLGKKVLLNFWSTYCGPCATELPYFEEVYKGYCRENSAGADSALLTVCIDRGDAILERIKKLEEKYGGELAPYTFPILLDEERITKDLYDISRAPTTFLINSNGIIEQIKIGRFKSPEEIEGILSSLE